MYANARGGQKRNVWLGGASEDGYDSSPIWGPGCLSGHRDYSPFEVEIYADPCTLLHSSCPTTGFSLQDEIALRAHTALNFLKGCGFQRCQIGRLETPTPRLY